MARKWRPVTRGTGPGEAAINMGSPGRDPMQGTPAGGECGARGTGDQSGAEPQSCLAVKGRNAQDMQGNPAMTHDNNGRYCIENTLILQDRPPRVERW